MQKSTVKQKCLMVILSLAVILAFTPFTAGTVFANDGPDYYINLEKANGGAVEGNEVKCTINLAEPWNCGTTQFFTGGSR